MGGRGFPGKREPRVTPIDLVAVALDDALLDEISAGGLPDRGADTDGAADVGASPRRSGRHADDSERLHRMLAAWRDDLRIRPLPARPNATQAARVVAEARRGRSSRPVAAVAAAIVVLLVGSAIVGSRSAQPGDALFPVTQALWADQADAAVAGEQVRGALSTAHAALQAGDARRAADALAAAAHNLPGVRDAATHQAMQDEITLLWRLVAAAGDAQGAGSSGSGGSVTDGPGDGAAAPGSASDQAATGPDASGGGGAAGAAGGSEVAGQAGGSPTGAPGDSSTAGSDGDDGNAYGSAGRLAPPSASDPASSASAPLTSAGSDTASSPSPTTSGAEPDSATATPSSSVPSAPAPTTGSSATVAPTPASPTQPADPPSSAPVSTSPGAPPTTATSDSGSATTSNTPTPSGSDAALSSADPTPTTGDPGTDQATATALLLGAKIITATTTSSSAQGPSSDRDLAVGVAMVGG